MKNLILIMIIALIPTLAQAQQVQQCGPHDEVAEFLTKKHGEKIVGIGVIRDHAVEFWLSEKGTWSYVVTNSQGVSCIMAVGTEWQVFTPEYKKSNEPNS